MRRNQQQRLSYFQVGAHHARARRDRRDLPRLHQVRSRSAHHYTVTARRSRRPTTSSRTRPCASPASTSARSPRSSASHGGEPAARGQDARSTRRPCRCTSDATLQDPPAHLPRGQLLRRHPARLAVRAAARRRRHVPGQPDQPRRSSSTRSRPRCRRTTRKDLQHAARRALHRPQQRRRRAATTARSRYWEPAYRTARSSPTRSCGEHEHDLSQLPQERRRRSRAALDRYPGAAAGADHRLQHHRATRSPREQTSLSAAIGELPRTLRAGLPALRELNDSFPPCAASSRDSAPGRALLGPGARRARCRSSTQLRALVAARAARPGRATCARPCRRWPAQHGARAALRAGARGLELPERRRSCRGPSDKIRRPDLPGARPGLPGVDQAAAAASPARAARATPTASGSACCSTGGNFAYPRAAAAVLPQRPRRSWASTRRRRRPARRRCAPTCRARPSSRPTCARRARPPPPASGVTSSPTAPASAQGRGRCADDGRPAARRQIKDQGLDLKVPPRSARRRSRSWASDRDPQAPARLRRDHRAGRHRRWASAVYILRQPAAALPVVEEQAVRPQGRVLDRAGRHARARARPCASSGVRVGDIAKSTSRTAARSSRCDSTPSTSDLVHTDANALLRPKTGLKDMFVELDPGSTRRAGGQARAGRSRSPTRCPTSTPTSSSRRSTPTRATTCTLLLNGAGRGPEGPRRRPARGLPPLRADAPRPRAASAGRSPSASTNLRRLIHSLRRPQQRAGRQGRPSSRSSSTPRRAVFRAFASRGARTSPRRSRDLPPRCARRRARSARSSASPTMLRPASDRACARRSRALDRRQPARCSPLAKEAAPIVRERDPPVRARGAPARARRSSPPARRPRDGDAGPDALVHGAQPPLQHDRLQPERPRGPGQVAGPRGGLPVLDRAGCGHNGDSLFSTSDANGPFRPITRRRHVQRRSSSSAERARPDGAAVPGRAASDPRSAANDRSER